MDAHFTSIVNTEERWNALCSSLDNYDFWKLFAAQLSFTLEEVVSIWSVNEAASPSNEILSRLKNDKSVTTSKFLEILSKIHHNSALSLIQSWIHEDYPNISINITSLEEDDVEMTASQLYRKAMSWYWTGRRIESTPLIEKAAQLNYPPAFLRLCLMNERQKDLSHKYAEECKKYKEWFIEHAKTGIAFDQYHLGMYYDLSEKNYVEARQWYEKAAEQGFPAAQNNLGWCFETGNGVEKNTSMAVSWFTKAADQNHLDAVCNLGYCYETGKGYAVDYSKAVELYKKATQYEFPRAYFCLALCHEDGKGAQKNIHEAIKYYQKAGEAGYANAHYNLGLLYKNGEIGLQPMYSKAIPLFLLAAKQGHERAQYWLGQMYEYGLGIPRKNFERAFYWYHHSAENGQNCSAQCSLGVMYYHGKGVKQDCQKAAYWFEQSAKQNMKKAQYLIGLCYEYGDGVTQDHKKALEWLGKAASISSYNKRFKDIQEVHKLDKNSKQEKQAN